MSKIATISNKAQSQSNWTSTQAYVLAVFCLLLGVALGYLFRGTASPAQPGPSTIANLPQPMGGGMAEPSPEQAKAAVDKAAAPLLSVIKSNPNDFESTVKLANLYYDAHLYQEAIPYYEQAVKINSRDADVRTDLGTAYWYAGNADKAIANFEASLKLNPSHAGTLFNMGVVKWQGKSDPAGAVAAWEELLKRNPDYPQKDQIEMFIAKAKQHAKG